MSEEKRYCCVEFCYNQTTRSFFITAYGMSYAEKIYICHEH